MGMGNPVKINKNLIGLTYGQGNPVKIVADDYKDPYSKSRLD